jgi:DNA-binding response OmpR family regulator
MTKTILIVDDNPANRKVLAALLTNEGYNIGLASDGIKALNFVNKFHPDLILLDVMMPNMSGFEVCKKLKSDQFTSFIPIIFLTARTNMDDIVKGFELGGADYIAKPFNSIELLARINTHIEMNVLKGIIPICSTCKKIRDDAGYWNTIEEYISTHTKSSLSHGMCSSCADELYGDQEWYLKMKEKRKNKGT